MVWWGTAVTWGAGGRDPHVASIGAALIAIALVMVQPWRKIATIAFLLPLAIAVAVWIVVGLTPTGWNGANDAASYVTAASLFVLVAGWARDDRRRAVVVGVVLVVIGAEFMVALWPWLGHASSSAQMPGSFFYTNTYAAFLVPGATLGVAVVIRDTAPLNVIGWVVTPLAVAGIVFSASRGSGIALSMGVIAVAIVGVIVHRWGGFLRAIIVCALSAGTCFVLTGPPFFGARESPAASIATKAESFAGNGTARFEYWDTALSVFLHWPITGAGFHSFSAASEILGISKSTAFTHNAYLQALTDGGLILGIPFWISCILLAVVALRQIWRGVADRRDFPAAALAITVIVLLLHSGMDFDWTFAASFALTAVVAGAMIPSPVKPPRLGETPGWCLATVMCASLALAAVAAWHGNLQFSFPIPR